MSSARACSYLQAALPDCPVAVPPHDTSTQTAPWPTSASVNLPCKLFKLAVLNPWHREAEVALGKHKFKNSWRCGTWQAVTPAMRFAVFGNQNKVTLSIFRRKCLLNVRTNENIHFPGAYCGLEHPCPNRNNVHVPSAYFGTEHPCLNRNNVHAPRFHTRSAPAYTRLCFSWRDYTVA